MLFHVLITAAVLLRPAPVIQAQAEVSPLWRAALGGTMIGVPAIQAGSAVVLMDSGSVKAYSTQGRHLWTYFARGRLSPFISRSPEGTSYIARTNGLLIAVNRVGRELWRTDLKTPLAGPVIVGWDGRLFIPTEDRIYCLTASGQPLWERNLGTPFVLPPMPDQDGGIIMVLSNAMLFRLSPFGEAQSLYLSAVPAAIVPLGPVGKGGRVLILYPNGGVEFTDLRSNYSRGAQSFPWLDGRPRGAAGWGLNVAVLMENGRLLDLDGLTGKIRWSAESRIPDAPELFRDQQEVYVLSKTGASGFAEEGRPLWHLDLTGASSIPGFGDDGILYSGGIDWILYAFRLEERPGPHLLYSPTPEGSYGTGTPPPSSWSRNPLRFEESLLEEEMGIIRRDIEGGRVGDRELEYTAYLMETANAGQDPETSRYSPLVHINHQVQALRLLARIGSRETIPFLARMFSAEKDPSVKAAAAQAIGVIGMDSDGVALRAFSAAVFSPSLREEQVLAAIAAATGAICRFSGPPVSDSGIRILASLTSPNRPLLVQNLAKRELESLGK